MPAKNDLREFLATRRAKLTPDQAGLPVYGANRRVAGLRREEVAVLAGISVEYYTRLERGNVGNVSDSVLDGITHALQLDDAERDHLYRLVRTLATPRNRQAPRRTPGKTRVRPSVQRILDQMPMPAYLRNGRFDILAANDLGRALYSPLYDQAGDGRLPNSARFVFLDPGAADFFLDYDKDLTDLIGELSTRSEDFRLRWAAHDVRYHRTGRKRFHHPLVGDVELDYEAFELAGDTGQRLNVYTAPPDSASDQALRLLASWTLEQPLTPAATSTDPRKEK